MYEFRSFHNSDPPLLAEIWRSQPPQRGLMQPISSHLLEMFVYSKQYFDPQGLIVATLDDKPVGFAHASFGPDETGSQIDRTMGVTQLVMVRSDLHDTPLGDELLAKSEAYLRQHGSTVLYGGGIAPLNAFYLGLYGGSELPGVLKSDAWLTELFQRNSYHLASEVSVLQRDLVRFRSPVSREHRQLRRDMVVQTDLTPRAVNWWWACQQGALDMIGFKLIRRRDDAELASVKFWDVEPLSNTWGVPTSGMLDLHVQEPYRRRKMAGYLLGESFKELQKRGISMVEAQTMATNTPALSLYDSLGFTQVDAGQVFRREP